LFQTFHSLSLTDIVHQRRVLQTFLTLSLTDMANRVQLSNAREAEKYVLRMVSCWSTGPSNSHIYFAI